MLQTFLTVAACYDSKYCPEKMPEHANHKFRVIEVNDSGTLCLFSIRIRSAATSITTVSSPSGSTRTHALTLMPLPRVFPILHLFFTSSGAGPCRRATHPSRALPGLPYDAHHRLPLCLPHLSWYTSGRILFRILRPPFSSVPQ